MDAVQNLLPSLNRAQKDKVFRAHLRLSKFAKVLPSTFYLENVEHVERVLELEAPSSDIYRAVYRGRTVFLKRYRFCSGSLSHNDRAEQLNREALIWAHHQHPGILQFIGVFQRDDSPYDSGICLVSPFLENGTIIDYLRLHPGLNRRLLIRDVFDAMAYLHSNSIVHGDLKGANVLIDSSGRARVADLGFSRLTAAVALTWTSIQSVASVATIPWQAPELLKLQSSMTPFIPTAAADVYSLGCMAYEVFTNQMPFSDIRPGEFTRLLTILEEVVENGRWPTKPDANSEAYSVCGLNEEIWTMMESCWLRDPLLRPSASELSALPFFVGVIDDRPST